MTEIKQIVVGVDGSESSRAALHWAYDEAAHHNASLVAVSTWHPPALPMSPPYGSLPPEGYETQPERDAREMLERLTDELEPRDTNRGCADLDLERKPRQGIDRYVPGGRPASGRVTRPRGLRRHAAWLGEPPRRRARGLPGGRPALIPRLHFPNAGH